MGGCEIPISHQVSENVTSFKRTQRTRIKEIMEERRFRPRHANYKSLIDGEAFHLNEKKKKDALLYMLAVNNSL